MKSIPYTDDQNNEDPAGSLDAIVNQGSAGDTVSPPPHPFSALRTPATAEPQLMIKLVVDSANNSSSQPAYLTKYSTP